jgi:hypothetical protein
MAIRSARSKGEQHLARETERVSVVEIGLKRRYHGPSFYRPKINQRDTYPGINHDPLIQDSIKDIN